MENIIRESLTARNYRVINACGYRPYYGNYNWEMGQNDYGEYPLPVHGAPMRAKNTFLAEMLRTGKYATGGIKINRKLGKPVSASMAPEKNYVQLAKQHKIGQLLGVEIEYYPKTRQQSGPLCLVGNDGSLNDNGCEIRKLTWVAADGRLQGLLRLKLDGKVDRTCGLHVHVDARHLGQNGLLGPEQTYDRVIEFYPMLKKLVPRSRHTNSFCLWIENRDNKDTRYAAVNYHAFSEHGTFEFRCQGGTLAVVKIETWALLCQWLVNFAARPEVTIPRSWNDFIAVLPEPLRSWCILRREKLYGQAIQIDDRTTSATLA